MKTFPSLFFIGLLFLSVLRPILAQTENLRFEQLSIKDGLSNNTISGILQDQKGYLWFGTNDGLNKYDGYSFTTYEHIPYDSTSLIQNTVFTLYEDKDGIIWVGTAESGISKFDRNTGKFIQFKPAGNSSTFIPPLRAVCAINEDKEGFLWVGNWLGELRRFNKETGKFFPEKYDLGYQQSRNNRRDTSDFAAFTYRDVIYCLYKDRLGTLWVGNNSGLHQLNLIPGLGNEPSHVKFTHYQHEPGNSNTLSSNVVTSIFEDHTGILWIGTGGGGLNRFDRRTGIFSHYKHDPTNPLSISSNYVYQKTIVEDQAGNLWIGTNNGLNKLNPKRTEFTNLFHNPTNPGSISHNFITSLFLDKSGILWIGSISEGVAKLDFHQKAFHNYRHHPTYTNSLSNDTVTSVFSNHPDIIWISTWGGGLNVFNKKTGKFTHYRHNPNDANSLASDQVSSIVEDNNGNLWILTSNALSIFNPKTGKCVNYQIDKAPYQLLGKDPIITMYMDRQGLVWLGTHNGLKSFNRTTGEIIHYRHDPKNRHGLSDHVCNTILQDKRGHIWVGHGSVGLSKFNKSTGTFTRYLPNIKDSTSLSTTIVYSSFEDSKGNLWFGTRGGGLCLFNSTTGNFTTFTKKHGLLDNTIYSIVEDAEGNLWLGTIKGLSRFSPLTKTFINYDSGDGLQTGMYINFGYMSRGNEGFRGKDGLLYYGGTNGLTVFDPKQLKQNRYVPPVVITQFKLFDKLVLGKEEAKEIILDYDQNFFSFEFSALNYTNSVKNQYAYQLVGIDKGWVYSGNRRLANYTKIPSGNYTFKVKASNNDGIWNEKGVSILIIINPPWWRTWWAYSFYGLCFLAAGFAVDRYQRKRLIQKEREKTRERELEQAREIEKAYQELKRTQAQLIQKEKMASLGELTAGIAHEIQNPLNFVNNFSEVNTELFDDLEQEIAKGDLEEAKAIVADLKNNEQKIRLHGKRADAIVKGMLEHSRASSGEKQLTDINALVDEYLRLSYHGLRAKDKNFTADFEMEADPALVKIEIVPQEIGRVLLNLFNNAFYSVAQKKAQLNGQYRPQIRVTTKNAGGKVEIRVKDNGTGIPESVKNKIFQPFFTTKPAGEGTGLGLSLSYDIITKGHSGELKVDTKEGEYSEFVILLPKS